MGWQLGCWRSIDNLLAEGKSYLLAALIDYVTRYIGRVFEWASTCAMKSKKRGMGIWQVGTDLRFSFFSILHSCQMLGFFMFLYRSGFHGLVLVVTPTGA